VENPPPTSQVDVVVVARRIDGLNGTTNISILDLLVEESNSRMGGIICAEDLCSLI
jgi:hypothetical protein